MRYYTTILALASSSPEKLKDIQPGCKKKVYDELLGIGPAEDNQIKDAGLEDESGFLALFELVLGHWISLTVCYLIS